MILSPHTSEALPRRHGAGLWAVFLAFLTVMAFSTVPTPLYALYQGRDGFSTFTITVIFAAYAVGVVLALFLAGHVSDWIGRRRTLVPAVLLSIASALVFLVWPVLPGLLAGRVLSGLSVGIVTATASAYLAELHEAWRPGRGARRAQLLALAANLGGLGLGPVVSGAIAQAGWSPLSVPFILFAALLALAALAVAFAPETVTPPSHRPRYRPQTVAVPASARGTFLSAAAGAFVAFAAFGLLTSLAPSFLAGTLGHHSHLLAGVPAFSAFSASVLAQVAAAEWDVERMLRVGLPALAGGLALLVIATWAPSLGLFLAGGVVTGVGAGLVFRGGIATVSGLAGAGRRAEVLAGYYLAGYLGISVPVLGLGVLGQLVAARVALLVFAVLLGAGIAGASRGLLGGRRRGGVLRSA